MNTTENSHQLQTCYFLLCYFFAEKSNTRLNASPKESFWRDFSRAGKKPPEIDYSPISSRKMRDD